MGDFTSINTALSGILAQRKALEVIGHNIANAQTDGYTRQTVQMQSTGVSGYGLWSNSGGVSVGTGVTVESVTRMREELLDQQARRAMSGDANASKTADILGGVERLMPEPSDTGIAAKLSQFWNAWDDAAASPGDVPTRQALLENAATLAGPSTTGRARLSCAMAPCASPRPQRVASQHATTSALPIPAT